MRRAPAIAALLTVAALLAGCGSYTKADFAASANAICASAVRQTRSIPPPSFANSGGPQQTRALARYLERVLPIVRSEAGQLRKLRRPSAGPRQRAALSRYLAAVAQAARGYAELAAAAERDDAAAIASAEASLRASPLASLATAYGLRSCATPGATGG